MHSNTKTGLEYSRHQFSGIIITGTSNWSGTYVTDQ